MRPRRHFMTLSSVNRKQMTLFSVSQSICFCIVDNPVKIDTETKLVVKEQLLENTDLSQLADELPSHEPRYILVTYRYEKTDGRVVYPYCMVFSTPEGIGLLNIHSPMRSSSCITLRCFSTNFW
ncbi:hypothetical protein D915_010571 [Fasciola hepatica]|uniref:ADF-H domain-containing protein n=1 Tax=Fasciola hepatica TaxID=6192 RepID=A0A4E0RVP7_FASHE|nr:hypothetical protein D915_010571 [Fasciola hepatica]